jgi:hypothetical protein
MNRLFVIFVAFAFAGCSVPSKPESPKPVITVCSGCGSEWHSTGPGQPQPIAKCPNCPMTPEEFERLKEELRKRKDDQKEAK